jgi:hypothetical protein
MYGDSLSAKFLASSQRNFDAKASDDAVAFKTWLRSISQKMAEAAVEGAPLDIGGVRVSDTEKATLGDIAKVLGATA